MHRYASWVRGLHLFHDETITSGSLSRLSRNSPGGILFPKLEWLHWDWDVGERSVPLTFFRLFISSHLKRVTLNTRPSQSDAHIPWRQLAALVQLISVLPTSLESLSLLCGPEKDGPLRDAISSLVCRCGPFLRRFDTCVHLSEAAIHHLTQLPNLRHWSTIQCPPRTVPLPIFPSLENLRLEKQAAAPWVHLLASHERGTPRNGLTPATTLTDARVTLTSLYFVSATLASSLLSSIAKFRDLVTLYVWTDCSDVGSCTFRLKDENVGDLAASLPRLVNLQLGRPCHSNSCHTTVTSLLSISSHCLDLITLETHFNTQTIVGDMQCLVNGGAGRDKAKCKLESLVVGKMPLEVRGEDNETVVMGFKVIFPCLTGILAHDIRWCELRVQPRS